MSKNDRQLLGMRLYGIRYSYVIFLFFGPIVRCVCFFYECLQCRITFWHSFRNCRVCGFACLPHILFCLSFSCTRSLSFFLRLWLHVYVLMPFNFASSACFVCCCPFIHCIWFGTKVQFWFLSLSLSPSPCLGVLCLSVCLTLCPDET